jgi:hypothetical protein
MKGNFLLGIVIVLLALSAYTGRQPAVPSASEARQEKSGEPLFSLQPAEIDSIKVLDAHGCVLVRQKGPNPQPAKELMDSIVQARVVRRFSPVSADFSAYGLTQPVRRVEVVWANGGQSRSVAIGSLNPVGNAVYVRAQDEAEVLLIGSYFLISLDMALQGLRAEGGVALDLNCSAGS